MVEESERVGNSDCNSDIARKIRESCYLKSYESFTRSQPNLDSSLEIK